tara:strand:+ start:768 stop:1424 length:657 start_codon:yes stop_codon:yes gene_type:complete
MTKKDSFEYCFRDSIDTNKSSPLVLMIHGYGSNEDDLFSFARLLPENYKIVSLRAPYSLPYGGFSWYDINLDDSSNIKINISQAKDSILKIKDFVENELKSKFSFDVNNICLIGFSQGTILSYALSLNYPNLFKKIIALSGKINTDLIDGAVKDYSDLKYFCSHGIQDQVIPVNFSRKSISWLKSQNINHTYKEYEMAHNVSQENFYDFLDWMKLNLK